jgi:hypothetical protein
MAKLHYLNLKPLVYNIFSFRYTFVVVFYLYSHKIMIVKKLNYRDSCTSVFNTLLLWYGKF